MMKSVWLIFSVVVGMGLLGCSNEVEKQRVLAEKPASVVFHEEYVRSIELLSAGRQVEAEGVVGAAFARLSDDRSLLFAQAVLQRSRWAKEESSGLFAKCSEGADYLAEAAKLTLMLDRHENVEAGMDRLVTLSDGHPDDVYLLWLSAIQCREQKMGALGKERYELLLKKFEVGPVLLHQSYANILDEQLHDYEAALVHRRIAVSMTTGDWALQGLANTLTNMGRYSEALEHWEALVELEPDDVRYWYRYGETLLMLGRCSAAVGPFEMVVKLDAAYDSACKELGLCLELLGRYEEAFECYCASATAGGDVQRRLSECYFYGRGVAKNFDLVGDDYCEEDDLTLFAERMVSTAAWEADHVPEDLPVDQVVYFCRYLDTLVSACEAEERIDVALAIQGGLIELCERGGIEAAVLEVQAERRHRFELILAKGVDE